jgi:hypothetical protein
MGLKPVHLLVERREPPDQRLVAVTRRFGEKDRLERHEVFGKKVILGEPPTKRIQGQAAGGQRAEKRSACCLIPQRSGSANQSVSDHRSFRESTQILTGEGIPPHARPHRGSVSRRPRHVQSACHPFMMPVIVSIRVLPSFDITRPALVPLYHLLEGGSTVLTFNSPAS